MLMCGVGAKSVAHLMKFYLLQWEVMKVKFLINSNMTLIVLNLPQKRDPKVQQDFIGQVHYDKVKGQTRLGQLGANISPDRSSLTPQVLIGNFLKHNYPLLYELQHINLLCLYLPRKMVYPQTPNT